MILPIPTTKEGKWVVAIVKLRVRKALFHLQCDTVMQSSVQSPFASEARFSTVGFSVFHLFATTQADTDTIEYATFLYDSSRKRP